MTHIARVPLGTILVQAGVTDFATQRGHGFEWAVGLTLGGSDQPVYYFRTEKEAEAAIAAVERVHPDSVHAGDYFIDGPAEVYT